VVRSCVPNHFKKMWRSKRKNSCAALPNEETTRGGVGKPARVPSVSPYVEKQSTNTKIGGLFKIAQNADFAWLTCFRCERLFLIRAEYCLVVSRALVEPRQ